MDKILEILEAIKNLSQKYGVLTTPLLVVVLGSGIFIGNNTAAMNSIFNTLDLPPFEQLKLIFNPQPTTFYKDNDEYATYTWPLRSPRKSEVESVSELIENTPPTTLVRFIDLHPSNISSIGKTQYVFFADYDELKGHTLTQALHKVGLEGTGSSYSILIIDVEKNPSLKVRPASVRGIVNAADSLNNDNKIRRNYPLPTSGGVFEDLELNQGYVAYRLDNWMHLSEEYNSVFNMIANTEEFSIDFGYINSREWGWQGFSENVFDPVPDIDSLKRYGARIFLAKNAGISTLSEPTIIYTEDFQFVLPEIY